MERVVAMMALRHRRYPAHVAAVLAPNDSSDHPLISVLRKHGIAVTEVVVPPRGYVKEYRELRTLLNAVRPSIVHTHGYHADIVAGWAARARGIRHVSTVHGFLGVPLRNHIYERLQLLALRKADAVFAVSRQLVERVQRSGVKASRIHLVPNGFVAPGELVARDAARKKLALPADQKIVGWVGRLSREKGADIALRAIALTRVPWRLSMIGDGPERDRLLQLANSLRIDDRVAWHGAIDHAGRYLPAFDAFLLSSRTEGTPIALLEAMHARVPIVATTVGGVADVVSAGEAILVGAERPQAIASALDQIAAEPGAAVHRTSLAHERLLRKFDADGWVASVESVYATLDVSGRGADSSSPS